VDADCPTHQTFGGREQIGWSADGAALAYTCKPRTVDAAWSVSSLIHVARLADDDDDDDAGAGAGLARDDELIVNYTTGMLVVFVG
jgi:hypothetical protein